MTLATYQTCNADELRASLAALDRVAHEPVQMKLLAWIMGLPNDLDPALAARLVLGGTLDDGAVVAPQKNGISAALLKLVEVVADYPRERLARMTRRRSALN